jgi:hypothetical protein
VDFRKPGALIEWARVDAILNRDSGNVMKVEK